MNQTDVEGYLQRIRAAGDASMRPCGLVTPALASIAPQRVGIAHLFLRPRFLLADPTGSGKTPMALAAYGYLKEKNPGLQMLVVTTKSAQFQWKASVEQFLVGQRVEVLGYGDQKHRLSPAARQARYAAEAQQADIWVTTYATLTRDETLILQTLHEYILVLDEVHWVKNSKAGTKKPKNGEAPVQAIYPATLRISQKARACWGLSATPLKNDRYDELFSVMEIIRPGTFGANYPAFRRLYYVLKLVKPKWKQKYGANKGQPAKPFYEVTGVQNTAHLQATIDPFYLRRPMETFSAHLPSLTFRTEDVFLDPQQRKLYDTVWAQAWPGKDGQKMQKITALQKAQQVLGAPELVDSHSRIPNAKLSALLALLQTELRDRKVIVYSKFVSVVAVLGAALTAARINYGRITGEDALGARDTARSRFQTDPSCGVILLTDAGGEALDLQAADVVLFYDLPWSYGNFQQVIGRARRIGSQHPNVLVLLLGATRSCDEPIVRLLAKKEQFIRTTLQQGNRLSDSTLSNHLTATATSNLTETATVTETDLDVLFSSLGDTHVP